MLAPRSVNGGWEVGICSTSVISSVVRYLSKLCEDVSPFYLVLLRYLLAGLIKGLGL